MTVPAAGRAVWVTVVLGLLATGLAAAEVVATSPGAHALVFEASSGFELRYTLWIPDGYSREQPVPVVLSLHYGFDRSRPYPEYFGRGMLVSLVAPALEKLRPVIVAPDSHGKGWSDPTIEASVVELMASVQAEYGTDPKRTAVVGYSMGGRGCWEYAARHPGLFTAAIPMASRVEMDTAKTVEASIFAIHSRDDERVPIGPLEMVMGTLKRMGRPAELLVVEGVRHHETPRFRGPLSRAVPWLQTIWND